MTFSFASGTPALTFLGTLKARSEPVAAEMLESPADLGSWLNQAGLADAALPVSEAELADALALREAIWSAVTSRMSAEPYDDAALELVNAAARKPSVVPQLGASGRRVEASVEQALSAVARDAIEILGGPDAALLKQCARPGCTQVYIDRSRGARREWCAMDPCGNKIKARAYRARKGAVSR